MDENGREKPLTTLDFTFLCGNENRIGTTTLFLTVAGVLG
jgi:hypothetical protein